MASQWVDDPDWGGIATAVGNSVYGQTGRNADILLKAEQIKGLRDKRARELQDDAALAESIRRIDPRYDAMTPPATNVPMPPNFEFGYPAAPNIGREEGAPFRGNIADVLADSVGGPVTSRITPAEPLKLEDMPRSWGVDEPFYRTREQSRADEKLGTRMSKTPAQLFQTRGLGQVTMTGVPTDPSEFARVQTQLKGEMPTTEGKTPHNWSVTDPNTGQIAAQGITYDAKVDIGTGRRLPPSAVISAPATLNPKSPLGDQEAARAALGQMAIDINSGRRDIDKMSPQDMERIHVMVNAAYPESYETVDLGGGKQAELVRKHTIPEHLQPIIDKYNHYLSHKAEIGEPLATARRPVTQQSTIGPYRPQTYSAKDLETAVREDPVTKKYAEVSTQWNGMAATANEGGPEGRYTNASDLSLIYGIARIFDDRTGVRDAELNLQQTLGSLGQTLAALKQRYIDNKGILPPDVRRELLYAAKQRMDAHGRAWDTKQREFTQKAAIDNIDPRRVLPLMDTLAPLNLDAMKTIEVKSRANTAAPESQPPVVQQRDRSTTDELLRGGP